MAADGQYETIVVVVEVSLVSDVIPLNISTLRRKEGDRKQHWEDEMREGTASSLPLSIAQLVCSP